MKKNEIIYSIGTTVYWKAGQMDCEGIVKDDLGTEKVKVKCISINGRGTNKEVEVKRDILSKKSNKKEEMGKGDDIKKKLVQTKYKKWSANQLISKAEKGSLTDVEIEVFKEILTNRGKTEAELAVIFGGKNIEAPVETGKKEKVEVVETEEEKGEVPEMKVIHKKEGTTHVVEMDQEEEEVELEEVGEGIFEEVISTTEEEYQKQLEKGKQSLNKKRSNSKSIILKESEEVKGLKPEDKVTFKPSPRLKIDGDVKGVVKRVIQSHKDNFKEYCEIEGENGKIFYKRSNSVTKVK